MAGHGRPQRELSNIVRQRSGIAQALRWILTSAAVLFCALAGASNTRANDIEMRLRIVWGGGAAQLWQGTLQVDGGTVSDLHDLGVSADSPGSKVIVDGRVQIAPVSELNFDGFDVTIQGTPKSNVVLEFKDRRLPIHEHRPQRFELRLEDFASPEQSQTRDLDNTGNKLILRRAPGDNLRVSFKRPSLVFGPGEEFAFQVHPGWMNAEANASVRLRMHLRPARSEDELWNSQQNLDADGDGNLPLPAPTSIKVPEEEGVYDLVVSLHRRGRIDVPGWRNGQITERKIQFVVLANESPPPDEEEWQESGTVDPTNPGWRAWATKIPGMSLLPGLEAKPLNNTAAKSVAYADDWMMELAPGQWQAFPIPITESGRPHRLEVEFPENTPQTLGISIVEPTEAGGVVPIGVDSGVYVPESLTPQEAKVARHRLVFWPRTKAPLVLLVNHRRDKAALFGRIRVYSGPDKLPPSPVASIPSERLLAAAFDKPMFAENFSADGQLDPLHQQVLDDWTKFYWGARRLAEYLKYAGYNGAVVCVAREGSAVYPSDVLTPTPRYDSGIFFTTGQDPIRKDVLEMMFRIFDREGLTLVPAVHFSGTVERLEQVRRGPVEAAEGLVIQTRGMPRYNPLHPQVQESMRATVRELTERYSHHPSFQGLAVQLAADSFAILADDRSGIDSHTMNRFRRTAFDGTEPEALRQFQSGADLLRTPELRKRWLQWRALELSRLYIGLHGVIDKAGPENRLWLLTNDLFAGRVQQDLLQPTLPESETHPVSAAALSAGIDARFYLDRPGVVLFRPQRYGGSGQLNDQAVNIQLAAPDVDAYFRPESTPGDLASGAQLYCERLLLPLPSFDEQHPFGSTSTRTQLHTHAPPAGMHYRAQWAHALATLDAHEILDGGAMLPLGQEEHLLPLIETYRMLPRQPFQVAAAQSKAGTQPVVVRFARDQRRTIFYMVNDSPWPVRTTLEYSGRPDVRLQTLDSRSWPAPFLRTNRWSWTVDMEPYAVVGGILSDPKAEILDWRVQLPTSVPTMLAEQIVKVREHATAAATPSALTQPRNLDFEQSKATPPIAGWEFKTGPGLSVQLDAEDRHSGQYALHMRVAEALEPASKRGVASGRGDDSKRAEELWLRSEAFPVPKTGRLYVLVRLKTQDSSKQPVFRVALDDQKRFYDPRPVGRGNGVTPLPEQWSDFLFAFEQLPVQHLDKLHLGFDLMSAGDVWIDDIQLYEMWFQADERNALLIASALAAEDLRQANNVRSAQQFLDSFWPRFLLAHGKPSKVSNPVADLRTAELADAPREKEDQDEARKSTIDQLRDRVPKVPFKMPFKR